MMRVNSSDSVDDDDVALLRDVHAIDEDGTRRQDKAHKLDADQQTRKWAAWAAVATAVDVGCTLAAEFAPNPFAGPANRFQSNADEVGGANLFTAFSTTAFDLVVAALVFRWLPMIFTLFFVTAPPFSGITPIRPRGVTNSAMVVNDTDDGEGDDGGSALPTAAYWRLGWLLRLGAGGTIALTVAKVIVVFAAAPDGRIPAVTLWMLVATGVAVVLAAMETSMGCKALDWHRRSYFPDFVKQEDAATKKAATLGRLLMLFVDDWPYYLVAFVFLVAAALAQIAIPWLTGRAIDSVALGGTLRDNKEFTRSIELLTGMSVACGICSGLRGCLFQLAEARLGFRLRKQVFGAVLHREMKFFDETDTGQITSRLTSDVTKVTDSITLNLNVFLRSLVTAVGIIVFMATLNWKLTLVTFVSIPIVTVISKVYGKYYNKLSKKVQDGLAKANEVAEQSIGAIKTVRSFAHEVGELERYHDRLTVALKLKEAQARAYSLYAAVVTALPLLVTALVLWYGGSLIIKGEITGGVLVSFAFYQAALSQAINDIGWVFSGMMDALGAAQKVFEYIDHEKTEDTHASQKDHGVEPFPNDTTIEFRNVQFEYPTRQEARVLRGINFTVKPGAFVALVGESGGGKSTCIELLQRFYDVSTGTITVGGVNIGQIDHKALHEGITSVGQEPELFSQSIADNISYGLDVPPPADEIEHAAQLANCHDFISALPNGYGTMTGERGTLLSGGQKQRVALARALVRRPKILLLDEATSALDAQSEGVVQESLRKLRSTGSTIITIAHRLSTIKDADRILVIDGGRVLEGGTHSELMDIPNGRYQSLVYRQTANTGSDTNTAS